MNQIVQTMDETQLGKLGEENPDLPIGFVKDVLVSLQEVEAGDVS